MEVDNSEAAEECAVLERIFLSVVMTQSDEQFEGCLRKFLPHILKKSGSEHAEVRAKVVEVLSHVSKRVRAAQKVALPVESLLDIYSQPGSSAFLLNFSIIYIKMGFVRLSPEDKKRLMPRLLEIAADRPLQHQESLCVLFLTNLKDFGRIKDTREKSDIFNVAKSSVKKLLLDISMDVLLFPYGCTGESNLTDISVESYKRLTRDNLVELNADYFEQLKINVIYFLSNLNSTEVFSHLVVASSDARYSVAELGETHLKMLPDIDYGDLSVVTPLYSLFLKVGTGGSTINSLNPRTRLKLLQNISKFRAIVWPAALKVLFESLYGTYSNPKIKNHALIFAANIVRNLPLEKIEPVWPILIDSGVIKLLREDTDRKNKIQAYQLLPTLVLKCSNLAKKDLKCIEFIFNAIENETDPDLRSAARDAAFSMARAYSGIKNDEEKLLYGLLRAKLFPISGPGKGEQIEGMRVARTAAVRFVSEACGRSPTKVYLLLKSAVLGDEDSCMEAKKALYNVSKSKKNKKDELLGGIVGFVELLELVLYEESISAHDHNVINEIVKYLRICLSYEVNGSISPISHPSEESPLVGKKLEQYYSSNPNLLTQYLSVLVRNIRSEASFQILLALQEIVGCLNVLSEHLVSHSDVFVDLCLSHTKDYVRILSAEIVSMVISQESAKKTLQDCLDVIETNEKDIEKLHGSIALLGFVTSRHGGAQSKHVDAVVKFLKHTNLQSVAITSLGNMSLSYPLPLKDGEIDEIVGQLLDLLFDPKTVPKTKDQICSTLSNMCVVGDFASKDKMIDKFVESSRIIKDVDLSFSTAEALTSAVLGKASPTILSPWRRDEESVEAFKRKIRSGDSPEGELASRKFDLVVERLLKNLHEDRHPLTRQSICFWLLGLIKRCSFLPIVEKWLSEIQNGFIDLLSDNNDLVQEGAGKGLAFVYDATEDKEKKNALLKMVIEQVTLGRKSVVKVSEETRLFQPDELGETPTGGKLSTYKELCQLASDLNQPDLIYKFMQLANHNSVWNSKKGAAYTISSLLSKAGDELEGQLPKVLVKLYRYQYDPMPNIQRSMSEVWSSLASPDTVEKYYSEIFEDLLTNLTNVTWRVRISCCAAVQDFMRGPSGNKIIQNKPEKIGELWSQLIRVMDDIHERTRNMAVSAAKSLSKICIRESKDGGKAGKHLSGIVLKVLLNSGIKNSVAEIRSLSIATLSEMIKEGLGKEDAPVVIVSLLRSCADIDLANLYVAGQAIDTLDKIRVPMLKSNNVVQALVSCLPRMDAETAEKIHLELVDLLKPSAGFGSRIVTSHFVVLMSHHLSKDDFQPMVGKFLGSLLSGLSDRSPGIRRQFASTIGQILRTAKDSSVERLLEKIRALYFEKDDEVRKTICHTLQAISLNSQDTVKDKEDLVLPLVFFAKHLELEADKSNKTDVDDWSDLWNDLAYTNNVLILNEAKVVELLSEASRSQSWKMKAQMARSARTLGLRENLSDEKRLELTRILLESLPGRTWDGKEHVLHALSAMAKQPRAIIESALDVEMIDSLIKECKKERESYKIHAFQALGEVVDSLEKDVFDSVYPLLKDNLTREKNDDEKEKFKLIETTYETVGKCWPRNEQKQDIYINEILTHMKSKVQVSTPQVQVAILACVSAVVTKSRDFLRSGKNSNDIVDLLFQIMDFCFGLAKNTKLKKEALNLLHTLQITFRGIDSTQYARLLEFFNKYSSTLGKEGAPEIKSRFADIKEMFSSETLME